VAGIDESSARNDLAGMQDRLARDPAGALGLPQNATADEVRAAFLELTKHYHPVRFGRMAADIQKLSNEVFLALRAAHDTLAKVRRRQTGPMAVPAAKGSVPAPAQLPALQPRAGTAPARPVRLGTSDSAARPAISGPAGTPAIGARTVPRTAANAVAARPAAPATPAPGPSRPASNAQPAAPHDDVAILDLLTRQQWDQARTALHQLTARDPASKRWRALACYARGREAQLEGRLDDARVELHDALDLDPELQLAKTALTELFTRRK